MPHLNLSGFSFQALVLVMTFSTRLKNLQYVFLLFMRRHKNLCMVVKLPLFSKQTEFFASLIQKQGGACFSLVWLGVFCIHFCGFFCTFKCGYWNGINCFCIILVSERFRVKTVSLSFLAYRYVFSDSIRICLVKA